MVISEDGIVALAALRYSMVSLSALLREKSQSYPESVLPSGIALAVSTSTVQVPSPEPTIH
jgi:hypothetical protein